MKTTILISCVSVAFFAASIHGQEDQTNTEGKDANKAGGLMKNICERLKPQMNKVDEIVQCMITENVLKDGCTIECEDMTSENAIKDFQKKCLPEQMQMDNMENMMNCFTNSGATTPKPK